MVGLAGVDVVSWSISGIITVESGDLFLDGDVSSACLLGVDEG